MSNLQITFQPDEVIKCFETNIVNNNIGEEPENFTVTVTPVVGNVTAIEPTTTCVTIIDDDGMLIAIMHVTIITMVPP